MRKARSDFRRKFMHNKLGVAGVFFILLTALASLLGYLVTPDSSPDANEQHLSLAAQKPGFSVTIIKTGRRSATGGNLLNTLLSGKEPAYDVIPVDTFQPGDTGIWLKTFDSDGLGDTLIIPYASLYPSCRSRQEAEEHRSEWTTRRTYLLGTDRFGRDMLSRMIIGARVSLAVGFISVLISLLIGITLGTLAGYFRGKTDAVIQWLINVIWSLPTLLLVVAITFVLGKGFWQIFIAVGLSMWVEVARILRGQIFSLREKEFIEAAKALGYSHFRIITRHILPNVTSPLIVVCAANFASAILLEAGLSFLGLGVQPPTPSWGMMVKEHFGYIVLDSAYLAIIPGLAIMLLVMAFNFMGNALRDALDVHMK